MSRIEPLADPAALDQPRRRWTPERHAKHLETMAAKRAELRCDICAVGQGEPIFRGTAKVLRFELVRQAEVDGRLTKRGVGVMHLCSRCWETTAAKRRRGPYPPRKSRERRAA